MRVEQIRLKLILAQMVLDGINSSTIEFMKSTYPVLSTKYGATIAELSALAFCSKRYARTHVNRLVKHGYVNQIECHNFEAQDFSEIVKDDDLVLLSTAIGASVA